MPLEFSAIALECLAMSLERSAISLEYPGVSLAINTQTVQTRFQSIVPFYRNVRNSLRFVHRC